GNPGGLLHRRAGRRARRRGCRARVRPRHGGGGMSDHVNPITGEVSESLELVPLNLAALDEDALRELFPTPIQAAGALIHARSVAARAPHALNVYRSALVSADRKLAIATALAVRDLQADFP